MARRAATASAAAAAATLTTVLATAQTDPYPAASTAGHAPIGSTTSPARMIMTGSPSPTKRAWHTPTAAASDARPISAATGVDPIAVTIRRVNAAAVPAPVPFPAALPAPTAIPALAAAVPALGSPAPAVCCRPKVEQ